MARARIRVELIGTKELHDKLHRLGDAVQKANNKAARTAEMPVVDQANMGAPGPNILALQSKIESTEDRAVVDIGPDIQHWYYQFFETGAIAHPIKPDKANALAFEGRDGLIVTKGVHHPGMKKNHFSRNLWLIT